MALTFEDLVKMHTRCGHLLEAAYSGGALSVGIDGWWRVELLHHNYKVLGELLDIAIEKLEPKELPMAEPVAIRCLPKKQAVFVCCKGSGCKGNSRSRFPKHVAKRKTLRDHRKGR